MKVVLQKDVPGLGKKDTAVDVAEGYARVLDRGLAFQHQHSSGSR